jgi:hypothetical protein
MSQRLAQESVKYQYQCENEKANQLMYHLRLASAKH